MEGLSLPRAGIVLQMCPTSPRSPLWLIPLRVIWKTWRVVWCSHTKQEDYLSMVPSHSSLLNQESVAPGCPLYEQDKWPAPFLSIVAPLLSNTAHHTTDFQGCVHLKWRYKFICFIFLNGKAPFLVRHHTLSHMYGTKEPSGLLVFAFPYSQNVCSIGMLFALACFCPSHISSVNMSSIKSRVYLFNFSALLSQSGR